MPRRVLVSVLLVFLWIQGEVTCESDFNNCVFHYWKVDWWTAVKTCEKEKMELLCYKSEKEINDITDVFTLAASGSAKLALWMSSSNCSSNRVLQECLSLHITRNSNNVWHYFQEVCDDGELYPFVCCINGSAESSTSTEYITSSQNSTSDIFDITDSSLMTSTYTSSSIKSWFCKATKRRGNEWPDTDAGKMAIRPCPGNSIGEAQWLCEINGQWRKNGPDLTKCRSREIKNLKENFNSTPASDVISQLERIFKDSKREVFGEDLADVLSLMTGLPERLFLELESLSSSDRWKSIKENMSQVTTVMDHIVKLEETWHDIVEKERPKIGTHLLTTMDKMGSLLADSMPENVEEQSMRGDNMALQVLKPKLGESVSLPEWTDRHLGRIMLQKGYDSQTMKDKGNVTLVFAIYNNMSSILSSPKEEENDRQSYLNSAVVSATVTRRRESIKIASEVRILVEHFASNPNDSACVFWNMDRNQWDTSGCHLESSNETHSACICNHLTNFALLMDYTDALSEVDQDPFHYITIVGSSLSIICLAICIVVFSCYSVHSRHSWGLRYVIHRNLCLTLLIAILVMVIGLDKTENERFCAIIAGLLHYFFLSAFSWMFLEAVHIYLLLVVVFASRKSHSEKYYTFGYGFPLIVVGITALSRPMYYGREDICWLSAEKGTIWAFMGPVAAILILNTAALILAQYKASRISVKDDKVALVKRWLRVTLILFPVLGITWVFGFLYLGRYSEIAGYLFAIFNSFQGVCIFVFHCLLDKKARNMVVDSFKKKTMSINTGSSSTQKKMKEHPLNGVKSNSITPIENDDLKKQAFQIQNKKRINGWFKWHKPWSFCFELPMSEIDSKKENSVHQAVIVHLNSLPDKTIL